MDDIIDTAGTLTKAGNLIMEKGAKSVRAMATHAIFSGNARQLLTDSPFTEIIVTDTIPRKEGFDKVKVLSTATLFAEVIKRVENYESISSLFTLGNSIK